MFKRILSLGAVLLWLTIVAAAQRTFPVSPQSFNFCSTHVQDLYCFLPSFGLEGTGFTIQSENVNSLNNLLGIELSLLPIPSPASGITFSFDPQLGLMTRSVESFGPILSERADTLGRRRIFLGFSYEHIGFDSFEGHSLKDLSAAGTGPNSTTVGFDSVNKLSVDQYTFFLGYGLTQRIDVSAAVPIRQVSIGLSGDAFGVTSVVPLMFGTFPLSEHRTRSGLSDIVFRAKAVVWKREHGGVALGADVRTPTGKPLEFMGAGAPGVRPFAAASFSRKLGRVYLAPHVNVGYEFNGTSILGGALLGEEGRLPRRLTYAAGTEVGIWKRATILLDFTGEKLYGAERSYFFVPSFQPTQVTITTKNVNIKEASVGAKINVIRNLLVTGNLSFKLDNGGLRARLIPLVGVSYTF